MRFLNVRPSRSGSPNCGTTKRYGTPVQKGGKYFFTKNDGLQNDDVLYVADSYKSEGRVLVDPNTWVERRHGRNGFIRSQRRWPATGIRAFPKLAATGSRFTSLTLSRVTRLASRSNGHARRIWWAKDGSGFLLQTLPRAASGRGRTKRSCSTNWLCFTNLARKQSEDKVAYCRPDHPDWIFKPVDDRRR